MSKQAGLWIDHKETFIVFIDEGQQETEHMSSDLDGRVHFSARASQEDGSADDRLDRQFSTHLGIYYDDVIAHIRDAETIYLFGPGEAKGELQKRLVSKGLEARIESVETADKMTPRQIAAKVRQHYKDKRAGLV